MKDTIGIVVVWLMILIAGAGVSILLGIFLAYQLDVLSTKAPDVWATERTELEVKPSYDQTDQYTPIQPADDWTQQDLIEEL